MVKFKDCNLDLAEAGLNPGLPGDNLKLFHLSYTILSLQQPSEYRTSSVRFANGLVFKWLGCLITILMLRNCHSYVVPFEYRTLESPVFR